MLGSAVSSICMHRPNKNPHAIHTACTYSVSLVMMVTFVFRGSDRLVTP